MLQNTNWTMNFDISPAYWNCLESKLIKITDPIVPMVLLEQKQHIKQKKTLHIKKN